MPEYTPSEGFNFLHPEAGEFNRGKLIPPGQWRDFSKIFQDKILGSWNKDLSEKEKTFLDQTADIGSRCVQYWAYQFQRNKYTMGQNERTGFIPKSTSSEKIVNGLRANIIEIKKRDLIKTAGPTLPPVSELIEQPLKLAQAISNVTGPNSKIHSNPGIQNELSQYSINIMSLITIIAEHHEGLVIDDYLDTNIKGLINAYMLTEPKEADS